MHKFEQATYFVRDVLDHATDTQLSFARLTTRERDALLMKDVRFRPMTKNYLAAFEETRSIAKQASVISYNYKMGNKKILDTAAHEQFHAARFWGNPATPYFSKHLPLAYGAGIALSGLGILTEQPLVTLAGEITLIGVPLIGFGLRYFYNDYHEERSAYRFGNLFNEKSYREDKSIHPGPVLPLSIDLNAISRDYPKDKTIKKIFRATKQECIGGNILFPDASPKAAFKDWRKQNGHILS